jgi:flagellar hook-associated protein 2
MSQISTSSLTGTFDLASLVPSLVAAKRAPETALMNRKAQADDTANAYQSLAKLLTVAKTAIASLATASNWSPLRATSSSAAVVASAAAGGVPSTLTFNVDRLATAESLYSSATYAGTAAPVMTANTKLLVASGGRAFGLGTLTGGAALPTGSHTIAVTQASAAATAVGSTPLGAGTVIDASNDTLDLQVNGVATSVTLAHGTYATATDLASAVGGALSGQGATASVSSGALKLATTREGSAASIQVVSGSALAALGLTAAGSPTTGTDGIVTVDGTATTVTSVEAGGSVVLGAPTGDVTATLSGGLRTGSLSARSVDVGDGSLGSVVAAINGAGSGVSASAVQVSPGNYRLQLTSATTGATGGSNLDLSLFQGTGGFALLTAGADAQITVSGAAPYTITSASNTFTGVMPGLSFTLQAGATGSVTVSSTQDTAALANNVSAAVTAVNNALTDIKNKTAYDATSGTSGLLSGDSTVQFLKSSLTDALMNPVAGGTPPIASLAGVTLAKDGTVTFDAAKFTTALQADPAGTQRLFTSMGTDSANPGVLERLNSVIDDATRLSTGSLVTAEQSQRDTSTRFKDQVDAMETAITTYEAGLRARFATMQSSLQTLQSQRSYLSTQIASLGGG